MEINIDNNICPAYAEPKTTTQITNGHRVENAISFSSDNTIQLQ